MLRGFFKFLNILAIFVLLLSCLATYIQPKYFWQLSFIGFAFPVVLVINVFFLLLWIMKRDVFGIISLIAIVLTWHFTQSTFVLNFKEEKGKGIKLMTWNVKNFDLYNWSRNEETREKMMELIKKESPDVLCMQEFYSNNQVFQNIEFIRDSLGYKYFYSPPSIELNKIPTTKLQKTLWINGELKQQWGVGTFSKFPITDTGRINFNNSYANACIYTDIDLDGNTVRLYNVHFESIHLGYEDYATLDSLGENQQLKLSSAKKIVRKMRRAYAKRAQQSVAVAKHISEFQGVQVLCGDFNDVPVSYTYSTAKASLNDAFVEKGKGFGATFANKFSIFRIDYAFFDSKIRINSYKTIRKELSDHYPVVVTFSL
ncbi:MAG: endonuclease/exonuclease/phosphatase family protein [Bacteroidota bacterium]